MMCLDFVCFFSRDEKLAGKNGLVINVDGILKLMSFVFDHFRVLLGWMISSD